MANVKISQLTEQTNAADDDVVSGVSVASARTVKTKLSTIATYLAGKSETLTNKTLTSPVINTGVSGTAIDTDGTLAANSDTKLASQKAVKTYADTKVPKNSGGWEEAETWTYSSADGATGVFNVASDVTGKYSPGMRVKYQQSQALTSYWSFDANSNDGVGSNNGTDTAVTYTAGKFSNAATFNGTTSKIVISDNASLKPTGEFTIGCWFKTGNTGATKGLFQSNSQNTAFAGIALYISSANILVCTIGKNTGTTPGTDYSIFNGVTTVTDNTLHYAVFSFRNNYLQVYLDGKLEISGYCLTPAYAATNYVRIGCLNNTGTDGSFFNGQIDDLFFINGYALDEKTIKAKYDAQTAQGTGAVTVQKYGLITAVGAYSGGNTPVTIWGGTDYSTANATISNPFYSVQKAPFGFPVDNRKWTVEYNNQSATFEQSNPVNGTVYSLGVSASIPIGYWNIYVSFANDGLTNASGQYINHTIGVSTSASSFSDRDMVCTLYLSNLPVNTREVVSQSLSKNVNLAAKTTYYLVAATSVSNYSAVGVRSDFSPTIIRATSTLL